MLDELKIRNLSDFCGEARQSFLKQGDAPELSFQRLRTLNEKMWGIPKKHITLIGARTSNGKTDMSLNIAYDLAIRKKKVLYISLEMRVVRLLRRLFSMEYKINNNDLRTAAFKNNPDMQEKFNEFEKQLKRLSFVATDLIGKKPLDITDHLKQISPIKPDVIFIDHIQEISSGNDKKKSIEEYLDHIRDIATKEDLAIVICSQINRIAFDSIDKTPQLHHLKGAGALEEKIDLAILLHWPHHYDKNKPFNYFEVNLAKNRDGETCYIKLKYEPQYSCFSEWEEPRNNEIS